MAAALRAPLPHPPAKVWRALTEPEHLAAWFPTTIEGERRAGAPPRFAFPMDESPVTIAPRPRVADVATICIGQAASAAAVLLAAGAPGKRSRCPMPRVLIHQPHGGAQVQRPALAA